MLLKFFPAGGVFSFLGKPGNYPPKKKKKTPPLLKKKPILGGGYLHKPPPFLKIGEKGGNPPKKNIGEPLRFFGKGGKVKISQPF